MARSEEIEEELEISERRQKKLLKWLEKKDGMIYSYVEHLIADIKNRSRNMSVAEILERLNRIAETALDLRKVIKQEEREYVRSYAASVQKHVIRF